MTMIERIGRALILAPHPDDEVLGCGGTIARIVAQGGDVQVAIVTRGQEPQFETAQVEQVAREALEAHRLLGVSHSHFLGFPAAGLDRMAIVDLNAGISKIVAKVRPDTLFVPFVSDLHFEHRLVFEAAMVAARPRGAAYPLRILAYETMSETNWSAPGLSVAFQPNVFVDIENYLAAKLDAFRCFKSQVMPFPDERSIKALHALALLRGATVSRPSAEAFVLVREVS